MTEIACTKKCKQILGLRKLDERMNFFGVG